MSHAWQTWSSKRTNISVYIFSLQSCMSSWCSIQVLKAAMQLQSKSSSNKLLWKIQHHFPCVFSVQYWLRKNWCSFQLLKSKFQLSSCEKCTSAEKSCWYLFSLHDWASLCSVQAYSAVSCCKILWKFTPTKQHRVSSTGCGFQWIFSLQIQHHTPYLWKRPGHCDLCACLFIQTKGEGNHINPAL